MPVALIARIEENLFGGLFSAILREACGVSKSNTDPDHPHKKAKDAFGGDPIDPGDWVLDLIAAVVSGGKKDDIVTRWAHAFKTICEEPNTPKRILLDHIADAVQGKANPEATAWASEEKAPKIVSKFNIDHLP